MGVDHFTSSRSWRQLFDQGDTQCRTCPEKRCHSVNTRERRLSEPIASAHRCIFMKRVLLHMSKTNTVTSFPFSLCLSFPNLMHARGEWWNAEWLMCLALVIHIPFQIGSATVLKINTSVLPLTAQTALQLIQAAPVRAGEIFPHSGLTL